MRRQDVPQDEGIAQGLREVCYAVDENGRYVMAASAGWEVKNVTNYQAWDQITAELDRVLREVLQGRQSPLAYHMARNLMTVSLLAQYMGIARWRVKRHLKPSVFNRLAAGMLQRYADLLRVSVDELRDVGKLGDAHLPGRPGARP